MLQTEEEVKLSQEIALSVDIEVVDEGDAVCAICVIDIVKRVVTRECEHNWFVDSVFRPVLLRAGAVGIERVCKVDEHISHVSTAVHIRYLCAVCL